MLADVIVPSLSLDADMTIRISCWLIKPGETVIEGDRLVELLIGEFVYDLPAPATGKLHARLAAVDQQVEIGQAIGKIEVDPTS